MPSSKNENSVKNSSNGANPTATQAKPKPTKEIATAPSQASQSPVPASVTCCYESVRNLFRAKWKQDPRWVVRCPGRVNIIGEHIDYSDYSVLPMAIRDSTFVALGPNDLGQIQLENIDPDKYMSYTFKIWCSPSSVSPSTPQSTITAVKTKITDGKTTTDTPNKRCCPDSASSSLPPPVSTSCSVAPANVGAPPVALVPNFSDCEGNKWHHYFLAGWRGMIEWLLADDRSRGANCCKEDAGDDKGPALQNLTTKAGGAVVDKNAESRPRGMNVVVGSTVPPSAGLSSSSALVCAAVLATFVHQTGDPNFNRISRKTLAEVATGAERYVGTEGGGMDQACECLASAGSALRIDFQPQLSWAPVCLPDGALFAVFHSGTEMNKSASSYYNQRVVECRIAAQVLVRLAAPSCSPSVDWRRVRTLRQAADIIVPPKSLPLSAPSEKTQPPNNGPTGILGQLTTMLELVSKHLHKDARGSAHSRAEVCTILGCTDAELVCHSLNGNTQQLSEFWLAKRAEHVYSEAARVFQFERVCIEYNKNKDENIAGDSIPPQQQPTGFQAVPKSRLRSPGSPLAELARLMNESHESCARLFECSCSALDETVARCLETVDGCLAARLTGAGWGGCVVALVDKTQHQHNNQQLQKPLFWSEPCAGIEVIKQ